MSDKGGYIIYLVNLHGFIVPVQKETLKEPDDYKDSDGYSKEVYPESESYAFKI